MKYLSEATLGKIIFKRVTMYLPLISAITFNTATITVSFSTRITFPQWRWGRLRCRTVLNGMGGTGPNDLPLPSEVLVYWLCDPWEGGTWED